MTLKRVWFPFVLLSSLWQMRCSHAIRQQRLSRVAQPVHDIPHSSPYSSHPSLLLLSSHPSLILFLPLPCPLTAPSLSCSIPPFPPSSTIHPYLMHPLLLLLILILPYAPIACHQGKARAHPSDPLPPCRCHCLSLLSFALKGLKQEVQEEVQGVHARGRRQD